MRPEPILWDEAEQELLSARQELASASPSRRQQACDRLIAAERGCTGLVSQCLASALQLERVREPRLVLSLDVDGVLESETEGFTSTTLGGVAALKLLQLGQVAVLLNTARCLDDVRDRVDWFRLIGGVASFGAGTWDAIFGRTVEHASDGASAQMDRLRLILRADESIVMHSRHVHSVRTSRIVDGRLASIPAAAARKLLDDLQLDHLTYWIANRYTDFVDQSVDKKTGIERLLAAQGLTQLPLAAMGDGACDNPMLRVADIAFLPAGALPSYTISDKQRLVRLRQGGSRALWLAACQLVPDGHLRREVLAMAGSEMLPSWLPGALRAPVRSDDGLFPRLVAAFSGAPGLNQISLVAKEGER